MRSDSFPALNGRLIAGLSLALLGSGMGWAQVTITGKPGLIYTPTAFFNKDPTATIGYSYNPSSSSFRLNKRFAERILFVNIDLLPRLELNFFLLKPVGPGVPYGENGIGDRQLDVKYGVLTEKKNRPAVAVIVTVPFGIDYSLPTYTVVASKKVNFTDHLLAELNVGYESPYSFKRKGTTSQNQDIFSNLKFAPKSERPYRYLSGVYGGVNLRFRKRLGVMAEWDTRQVNVGVYGTFFKHWTVQAGLVNGEQITVGTSYAFTLIKLPKRLAAPHEAP